MAHDVFISYSHHDKAAADAVCAKLEQLQVRCWIAPRDVVPGIEWADSIISAISNTRIMVLVFSSNANDSPQIRKEVERAVHKGVIIVPLRIEDVVPTRSLEYFMSNVHWLDAITPPVEKHLDHLAGTVKMLLERAESGEVNEKYSGIRPGSLSRSQSKSARWFGFIPLARRRFYLTSFAITVIAVTSSVLVWRHIYRPLEFPRLAVIGPTNDTKDPKYDYLTTLVADIVSADLSQPKGLNAVPPQDIVQMRQDISIPSNICSGDVHPVPLQSIFAASYLIFGSFHQVNDQPGSNIHIALCLLDRNGKVLGNPFEQDREEGTIRIFSELAADYFRRIIGDSRLAPQDFDKIFPQDPAASRLYFQGLADMRVFDAAKARDALQAAAHIENSNPLIHSALSQAWSMLRMNKEARDEAIAAATLHLPTALPLEFNTGITAAAAEMNKQWPEAVDLYNLLYESYPERLDLGLKLAGVQIEAEKSPEALKTLEKLGNLPRPLGQDPRISIAKSQAFIAQSKFREAIRVAESAFNVAKDKNFQVMQANAQHKLCWAYLRIDDIERARTSCDQAEQLFRAANDSVSAAAALNDIATWLTSQHQYDEANRDYEKAISTLKVAQDQKDLAGALLNQGRVLIKLHQNDKAEKDLGDSILVSSQIHDDHNHALALINLAEISRKRGKMEDVVKQASEARDLDRKISRPDDEAFALSALALAEAETGELSKALADNNTLLKLRQNPTDIAITTRRIGDVYLRMADLSGARTAYQKAYDLLPDKQSDDALQAVINLAEVDLDERKFSDAETRARQVLQTVSGEKDAEDTAADALASLLRALVGEGKSQLPQAVERSKDFDNVKFKSTDEEVVFDVALAKGTVLIAEGNATATNALGLLEKAASDALAKGQLFTSLQLKLVAVQAMEKSGHRAGARKTLQQISESAQHLGFKLISNQANDLARSLGI